MRIPVCLFLAGLIPLLGLFTQPAQAQSIFELPGAETLQQAQALAETRQYNQANSPLPVTKDKQWFLLDITDAVRPDYIHLSNALLSYYAIYQLHDGLLISEGGLANAGKSREVFHPEFLVPLSLTSESELLLLVDDQREAYLEILFPDIDAERSQTFANSTVNAIYFGAMAVMTVFLGSIAVFGRDSHSGRLALTLLLWAFAMFTAAGYAALYLWPNNAAISIYIVPLLFALAGFLSAWFCWHFLNDSAGKFSLRFLQIAMFYCAAIMFAYVINPELTQWAYYALLLCCVSVAASSVSSSLNGDRASLYLIASTAVVVVQVALSLVSTLVEDYSVVFAIPSLLFLVMAIVHRLGDKIRANEVEAEIHRTKQRFLATMSHEIRTPLNGIIGFSELCMGEKLRGSIRDYVHQINRSSHMLLSVVDNVLDYSKLDTDNVRLDIAPLNLQECVQGTFAMIRPKAEANNVQLVADLAENLPETVSTDPYRCQQILINLCNNAVKFTHHGRVTVKVSASGGLLTFTVTDTGIGIDKQVQESLFNPFEQADVSTTRRYGGTGLGLTISKQLAELLGGDLRLTSSKPEVGSVFTLDIPFKEHIENSDDKQLDDTNFAGLSVLVADDNQVNRLLARKMLEVSGITVDQVSDGKSAVNLAQDSRYDLILMDLEMPELSGSQATIELREAGCHTPIIAMTASDLEADRAACLDAGMNDFLTKPIARERLMEKIDHWSNQH